MEGHASKQFTQILRDARAGDRHAANQLLPAVYEQLRAIAQRNMNSERAGHPLQATALVHEAYMRLLGDEEGNQIAWDSRGHFYVAAAEAMRRILIEHARGRDRIKRGGGRKRVPLNVVDLASEDDAEEILAVDEAFHRLEQEDPSAAQVVRLRFYAGLSVEETAKVMNISPRSVAREWAYARAWLQGALSEGEPEGDSSA
jgi:RNA polymerase sigma factor (TIGR02999 family)